MATARSSTRKPTRRSSGRAAPRPSRTLAAFSLGALAVTAGAVAFELLRRFARPEAGTTPTDLMRADHPGPEDRAIDAFRPDPTASVPASEREALRPALARPTLVAG